ncbi:sensor histidine kinase [Streptomyces sp. NPDC014734]|uniref:sensor histidine kinase n=1 Tax=Streptomyces sp. NPDC014734 TaxID=3364886 RepID=UPI0037030A9A
MAGEDRTPAKEDDHRGIAVWEVLRERPMGYLLTLWPLRCLAYVLSGAVLGYAVLIALIVLVVSGVTLSLFGIGLLILVATAVLGVPVAALERRRIRLVEPEPMADPHSLLSGVGIKGWFRARLEERATWRELGYVVTLAVLGTASGAAVALLVAFSLFLTAAPLLVWAAAPDTVTLLPGDPVGSPADALPATFAGLVGLALSGYAAGWLAGAQAKGARFMLSPRDEGLSTRVIELTRSRARLVDAFEAERRRIERDLHDGAQQQLVALSMTLGLAEMQVREENARARELIARGRGEARLALEQLRRLVRDIHPQVLTDHGLATAVTEVALRNPIDVTVDIDLPHRLPTSVESTAYFTVTEALANAGKHSGASRITITGRLRDDRLHLAVVDDGRGGADPDSGDGLRGLADRVAILRGRLTVVSPLGGPTELRVEVPCSG